MYRERPTTAPLYRSKLAGIFGTRLVEAGTPLQPGTQGFLSTANGATMMTPRGAVAGMPMGYAAYSPRAPPAPSGGYSSLGPMAHSPRSPRAAASARASQRVGSAASARRAAHMQRQDEIHAMVASAQERITQRQQRDKMKRLMQSIANPKEEVPIGDLLLTAELANVPLSEQQQSLFFKTPLANRYAATFEVGDPRNSYGLECPPRSVKWRAFGNVVEHAKLQTANDIDAALKHYADKEAFAIAEEKRRNEEAAALAKQRAEQQGQQGPKIGITDEQLRMVHRIVKQRLSTQFAEIRTAFRTFDKDHSGTISAEECTDALMSLNVGVPRKWVDHLVNVADYDRDGEINYAEFARILSVDDITEYKKEGAEEAGLVQKVKDWYKPGLLRSEMRAAQSKVRDMLFERGGLTKMFRAIDEDKSGACSRAEVRMLVMNLNLESIVRPAILEELINLMDVDGDDTITYKEFARVCTSDDIFDMQELVEAPKEEVRKVSKAEKKRAVGLGR